MTRMTMTPNELPLVTSIIDSDDNDSNSFDFYRSNNILVGSNYFVDTNSGYIKNKSNDGIYETNNAGDAIPRPRKLRRVVSIDSEEQHQQQKSPSTSSYSRIRSTNDTIHQRKTHRRSPCLLVGDLLAAVNNIVIDDK